MMMTTMMMKVVATAARRAALGARPASNDYDCVTRVPSSLEEPARRKELPPGRSREDRPTRAGRRLQGAAASGLALHAQNFPKRITLNGRRRRQPGCLLATSLTCCSRAARHRPGEIIIIGSPPTGRPAQGSRPLAGRRLRASN